MAIDKILEASLKAQAKKMLPELDKRKRKHRLLDDYYEGGCPLPQAVVTAKVTKAYRLLMPMAEAPWASLVVDSVLDRLEVNGITSPDKAASDAVWGVWQDNQMDAESKLAHSAALVSGRAFALVWPDSTTGQPKVSLDNSEQMVVLYREGSRRDRVAALRRWVDDDDRTQITIYRPDGIFKLQESKDRSRSSGGGLRFEAGEGWWEPRASEGDAWVVENPFKVVPVVELVVNPRLKAGQFGHARGEFAHCIGLIDRINLLTFLGLVVAFWMGFPLRGTIGEEILKDDEGNPLAPFDAHAGGIFQLENPEAKIVEYKAADRKNLSIFAELSQLSTITKTPRHYFPQDGALTNVSADTIRADEGALHAKVQGLHKPFLGEAWEDVLRLAGLMLPESVALSPRATLEWADHESRSLAERADAALKMKDILPWQVIAQRFLNATSDDIDQWAVWRSSDGLGSLLAAATTPAIPSTA